MSLGLAALGLLLGSFCVVALGYLWFDRQAQFSAQTARLAAMEAMAGAPAAPAVLADDRAIADSAPFAQLRLLATHNSYRSAATPLGLFLMDLVKPGSAADLAYAHPPLSAQLNAGLRSFELDVRPRASDFVIAHVPLVDARTSAPDFALALHELALWSARNPGHLPLLVLLELKSDYAYLDPTLRAWDGDALARLDATVASALGARLLAPGELSPPDGEGRVTWPLIGALRGKIMVALLEDETWRVQYELRYPDLARRHLFTSAPGAAPATRFAILDDPQADSASIAAARSRGTVVRTRADANSVSNPRRLAAALASRAAIVSTDFPPGQPAPDGYVAALPGGRYADLVR